MNPVYLVFLQAEQVEEENSTATFSSSTVIDETKDTAISKCNNTTEVDQELLTDDKKAGSQAVKAHPLPYMQMRRVLVVLGVVSVAIMGIWICLEF